MAKARADIPERDLYEEDFYLWTREQADLLRNGRFADLDLAHVIEEIESLGRGDQREVFSRIEQIIQHALKLEFSPASEPRRGWKQTLRDQRDALDFVLTPSLRNELVATFETRWRRARRRTIQDFRDYGEPLRDLPETCPYTLEQILDPDWLPGNRHGRDARAQG